LRFFWPPQKEGEGGEGVEVASLRSKEKGKTGDVIGLLRRQKKKTNRNLEGRKKEKSTSDPLGRKENGGEKRLRQKKKKKEQKNATLCRFRKRGKAATQEKRELDRKTKKKEFCGGRRTKGKKSQPG